MIFHWFCGSAVHFKIFIFYRESFCLFFFSLRAFLGIILEWNQSWNIELILEIILKKRTQKWNIYREEWLENILKETLGVVSKEISSLYKKLKGALQY